MLPPPPPDAPTIKLYAEKYTQLCHRLQAATAEESEAQAEAGGHPLHHPQRSLRGQLQHYRPLRGMTVEMCKLLDNHLTGSRRYRARDEVEKWVVKTTQSDQGG
jgi:hypothetical protein